MAKIHKLNKNGKTIYPATIPQAVIDPESGISLHDDLALKADHGYEINPKTLKEVDDDLAQLAGEVDDNNIELKTLLETQATQLLQMFNSELVFGGFVSTLTPTPTHEKNKAWIAVEDGRIFGISPILKGYVIWSDGSEFISKRLTCNYENLFSVKGSRLVPETGLLSTSSILDTTPFIIIDRTQPIKIRGRSANSAALIVFYDKDKNFISSINDTALSEKMVIIEPNEIPSNTVFIRASATANRGELYLNSIQSYSTLIADLIERVVLIEGLLTEDIEDLEDNLKAHIQSELDSTIGDLFSVKGVYLDRNTGVEKPFIESDTTDFIRFNRNTDIKVKGRITTSAPLLVFYDSDKNFISSLGDISDNNKLITIVSEDIPINAVYLRASKVPSLEGILQCGFIEETRALSEHTSKEFSDFKTEVYPYSEKIIETQTGDLFTILNTYIDGATGIDRPLSGVKSTDFIRFDNTADIQVRGRGHRTTPILVYYDKNKKIISSWGGVEFDNILTTIPSSQIPSNAEYVRAVGTHKYGGLLLCGMINSNRKMIEELQNSTGQPKGYLINVTNEYPISGYHTSQTARSIIPIDDRKRGLIISYETSDGVWSTEMFIGQINRWVKDEVWQSIRKDDKSDYVEELRGDEVIVTVSQGGVEKFLPLNKLQAFMNSRSDFPNPTDTLFYPDYIDYTNSKWIDKSGATNDAHLVNSNCGTVKIGTELVFATPLSGSIGDWDLTNDGTSVAVLSAEKITFTTGGTIYNMRLINNVINKSHYYPMSEGSIAVYDCSGNSNHITIKGSTINEWTANKQDDFHYNLKNGGSNKLSKGLIDNPTLTGSYVDGLPPTWEKYSNTTTSEETAITIHGQALRASSNEIKGTVTTPINMKYKVGDVIRTKVKVYVISGKVQAFPYSADLAFMTYELSKELGAWETLTADYYVTKIDDAVPHKLAVRNTSDTGEWIVGDVEVEVLSTEVIVPSVENSHIDAVGSLSSISGNDIFSVETEIKFDSNPQLIQADIDNYLFNVQGEPNEIRLSHSPKVVDSLNHNNRLIFNKDNGELFIFKNNIDKKGLESIMNRWGKPFYQIYKNRSEYLPSINIDVWDINRNYRVGIRNKVIYKSNDYGKTWVECASYSEWGHPYHIFITSKGTVILFMPKSLIKRMSWEATIFTDIKPVDENGLTIEMHTPVNPSFPGEYYKPYHKLLDIYDASDNSNLIAWGTWNNNRGSNGAAPSSMWYSTDDGLTIKRFYLFGQNPNYTDTGGHAGTDGVLLGDANNPLITRHIHEISYNPYNKKIYIACGDSSTSPEMHLFETSYNKASDTWSPFVDLITDTNRNQIHRAIGIGFDSNGYMYFGSDADFVPHTQDGVEYDVQGVFKVHIDDFDDISKYELLHTASDIVVNSFMYGDNLMFTVTGSNILHLSRDKGITWAYIDIEPYMVKNYPYDIDETTLRTVESFKVDDKGNILLKCGTGVYLNII